MDFFAFDVVSSHECEPVRQYVRGVVKKVKPLAQLLDFCRSLLCIPSETIDLDWSRRYSPELNDILSRNTGNIAA
jgi:hypothetical protein